MAIIEHPLRIRIAVRSEQPVFLLMRVGDDRIFYEFSRVPDLLTVTDDRFNELGSPRVFGTERKHLNALKGLECA